MIRQKTFIGKDYISLRTKIHKWLEKKQNIRILNTTEFPAHPQKNRKPERIIVVQYELIR